MLFPRHKRNFEGGKVIENKLKHYHFFISIKINFNKSTLIISVKSKKLKIHRFDGSSYKLWRRDIFKFCLDYFLRPAIFDVKFNLKKRLRQKRQTWILIFSFL